MLKIDKPGISLSCFYGGEYVLFIVIDQVILSACQTVVRKCIYPLTHTERDHKLYRKPRQDRRGAAGVLLWRATETADIKFEWTRRHSIDKGTHMGRHLIQAFEPGEVSAQGGS